VARLVNGTTTVALQQVGVELSDSKKNLQRTLDFAAKDDGMG